MPNPLKRRQLDTTKREVLTSLGTWGAVVAAASSSGLLAKLPAPLVAPLILGGIVLPTIAYARSPELKALARDVGIHKLSLFHSWRVVGTAAFLFYGSRDELPPAFVRNAAWGDLATSILAGALIVLPRRRSTYIVFHVFGLTDFAAALATGLSLTLRGDGRMRTIAKFPLALIPLFGVGLSGAAHFIAFDLLRDPAIAELISDPRSDKRPVGDAKPTKSGEPAASSAALATDTE
jgi:hypothetical protein